MCILPLIRVARHALSLSFVWRGVILFVQQFHLPVAVCHVVYGDIACLLWSTILNTATMHVATAIYIVLCKQFVITNK